MAYWYFVYTSMCINLLTTDLHWKYDNRADENELAKHKLFTWISRFRVLCFVFGSMVSLVSHMFWNEQIYFLSLKYFAFQLASIGWNMNMANCAAPGLSSTELSSIRQNFSPTDTTKTDVHTHAHKAEARIIRSRITHIYC